MEEYEFHEHAEFFPLMEEKELDELTEDIKKNGLLEPIDLLDKKILDGRNRFRACKKAKIEPIFRVFNYNLNPLDYITSKNIKRRHLTTAQKAEIALKIYETKEKDLEKGSLTHSLLFSDIASVVGIRTETLAESKIIKDIIEKPNGSEIPENNILGLKPQIIKRKKEDIKKIKEEWEKAKQGQNSIKKVYEIATKKKSPRKSISYKKVAEDLKMKYNLLKIWYNQIKEECIKREIWQEILDSIVPKVKKNEKKIGITIKELREAELV